MERWFLGDYPAAFKSFHPAALLKPAFGGFRTPQRLTARVVEVPPDRLKVGVNGDVIGGVEFDAVPVGVAQVEEESVGDAMTARPALDSIGLAGPARISQALRMLMASGIQ